MKKLFPMILALIGLAAGAGSGFFLRPAPLVETASEPGTDPASAEAAPSESHGSGGSESGTSGPEYVKLSNQFVVPVLSEGKVASLVVLALSLEVKTGSSEAIYAREPKLRDAFLQVMFDHANAGGFNGSFTDGSNLMLLRKALLEAAKSAVGEVVTDVLISDIVRQDS